MVMLTCNGKFLNESLQKIQKSRPAVVIIFLFGALLDNS